MNRSLLSFSLLSLVFWGCEKNGTTQNQVPQQTHVQPEATPAQKDIPAPPDVATPPKDAQKTNSGLSYKVLQKGTGTVHPALQDVVEVHITGWTTDGKMFGTTAIKKVPRQISVDAMMKGWTESIQLMAEGEKTRFWIPADLAYGDKPKNPGAPAGMLVFDVELVKIIPGKMPIPAPSDVAAPPKDSKKTSSGLSYRVLQQGKGQTHPTASSNVKVHYTGWTTNGKMFDSSVVRGEPAAFPLGSVIPGWTEGVQLMVEGEKTRFWIPAELAYGNVPQRPGAPVGMLVFDIELLQILPANK